MKTLIDVLIYIASVIFVLIPTIIPVSAYILMRDIGINHYISLFLSSVLFTLFVTYFMNTTRRWALEYKDKQ